METRIIKREVLRASGIPNALFRLEDGAFLCQASIWPKDDEAGQVQIVTRVGCMDIDRASAVAAALQMAIGWVNEEINTISI